MTDSEHSSESKRKGCLLRLLPEALCCLGLVITSVILARMIYHDVYIDHTTYSNRSFGYPAAGYSFSVVAYLFCRLRMVPLVWRITVGIFVFFIGYITVGFLVVMVHSMW